jgi:diaminohydroxyphosphoribosylaminopyrimidine deaminase / 5-amino-6-(5-phosphoribosylamino)uracil reductase
LYVTFEPCNHHGRTGPCTEAILAAGIARVVIGCADPTQHAKHSRKKLLAAGLEVDFGVRREQAEALVEDFAKLTRTGMPFVTLKAAVTLDGKLATASGDSRWVSSEAARREAHRLRAESDAVLVGAGTALADDPELNVRHVRGPNPLRVVLDSKLRLPLGSKLARVSPGLGTLVFHGPHASAKKRSALRERGVELCELPVDTRGRLRLRAVLRELGRRDVMRLLVEGGAHVHGAFLDAGLADRAVIAVAPRILADANGISLASGRKKRRMREAIALEGVRIRRLGPDVLFEGRIAHEQ